MNDLVSIIMPSYNTAEYIAESIDSVINQSYTNWELIIVDDASTDNTDFIVEHYLKDRRIRYLQNERNSGAAISRNRALAIAKGKWIAFLDSDDLWDKEKLNRQVSFMEQNGYHFSYTNYEEIDSEGNLLLVKVTGPRKITRRGMYCYCWPGCLTVMYDAQYCGLLQIEDIKKNNDYAMWLKISKKADCFLLDEYLASYRRGRNGSISTHNYKTLIMWHYKLWHECEKCGILTSLLYTFMNMAFGLYKKYRFVFR